MAERDPSASFGQGDLLTPLLSAFLKGKQQKAANEKALQQELLRRKLDTVKALTDQLKVQGGLEARATEEKGRNKRQEKRIDFEARDSALDRALRRELGHARNRSRERAARSRSIPLDRVQPDIDIKAADAQTLQSVDPELKVLDLKGMKDVDSALKAIGERKGMPDEDKLQRRERVQNAHVDTVRKRRSLLQTAIETAKNDREREQFKQRLKTYEDQELKRMLRWKEENAELRNAIQKAFTKPENVKAAQERGL